MTLPATMRAIEAGAFAIDSLRVVERPVPRPRRGEILVRVKAASLNYRDLAVLAQGYMPALKLPYVPASDCCGDVVAVGEDVTRFKTGDRVVPLYTQGWHAGMPTLELRTQRIDHALESMLSLRQRHHLDFCAGEVAVRGQQREVGDAR